MTLRLRSAMRDPRAKTFVLMLGWLWFGCAPGEDQPRRDQATGKTDRGKEVYRLSRCGRCHSIEGVGNPRHPLDGVGSRLSEDSVRKWIVSPQEMNPEVAKRAYDDLPKEDLDALVAYLMHLK